MSYCKTPTMLSLCIVVALAVPSLAGPLSTDVTSYEHGSSTFQGYETDGITPTGLTGHIDWAVYAPGVLPAGFAGYVPPADEYLYTYQAYETNIAPLSSVLVVIGGPADSINVFTATGVGGMSPNNMILTSTVSALWTFDGVPNGGSTVGLAFSSPNAPVNSVAFTVDDGSIGVSIPVPGPNPSNIPEPGTLTLAVCGMVGLALGALRKRRRRGAIAG